MPAIPKTFRISGAVTCDVSVENPEASKVNGWIVVSFPHDTPEDQATFFSFLRLVSLPASMTETPVMSAFRVTMKDASVADFERFQSALDSVRDSLNEGKDRSGHIPIHKFEDTREATVIEPADTGIEHVDDTPK